MACYTGTTGAMEFGSNNVAEITAWTVTHTQEVLDKTVMGTSYRAFCNGLKVWEGSAEVIWTANGDSNASVDEAFTIGQEASCAFYWENDGTPAKMTGTGIVTAIEYSSTVGELATASVSLQGTGGLTIDSDAGA